uniref:WD repeat-containing protein 44 n=1 Tax=Kalanchoe fedtschenkoi TaxID=63787 RepID=A0A7N0SW58_KALFE
MSRSGGDDEEEAAAVFYESLERIPSSGNSSETEGEESGADGDSSPGGSCSDRFLRVPKFPMGVSTSYEVWMSEPVTSVEERRGRLLRQMGLSSDPALSRAKCGRSVSSDEICRQLDGVEGFDSGGIHRSRSESSTDRLGNDRRGGEEAVRSSLNNSNIHFVNSNSHGDDVDGRGVLSNGAVLNKPPSGRSHKNVESGLMMMMNGGGGNEEMDLIVGSDGVVRVEEAVLRIKNLDNGKEFVVNGVREDGMCSKLKEVGTGKQLTMEEFDICAGHSPIVQELMRRQNVEEGGRDCVEKVGSGGSGTGSKKKGSWLKNLRSVTSGVAGHKERRSSDERDNSSERGGRRSSSATDDSQDVVFHGPERVRVRQNGKSSKELSALYKSQQICAHNGSIWSIKFSLDGRYLASAGEDSVIHVWQVVGSERKGDLLTDEVNSNILLWANGSPELSSSPILDNPLDKKRRNRSSLTRKSLCLDNVYVPETVFALSDKPYCSFQGHTDDVLDLSWSKSQHLLSSSMDKTVRLWHLSTQACLKIFSHNDFVTCIHFNPADDRYFISGSLDAKVRIWSIPDHRVVDWTDVREMVTAACYTPDGQGALIGSYKGNCRMYSTTENKLVQNSQINLQNKKKKSHQKKITGFQFTAGSQSEVLVTSADSRVRVIDGVDLVHKFKGFRNAHSQISASLTTNGKYIVAASEDSNVYVWRHEADSRPRRSNTVTVTQAYENFLCQDVSVAIPWSGPYDSWSLNGTQDQNELNAQIDRLHTAYNSPTAEPTTSSAKIFGVTSSPRRQISETANDEKRTSTSSTTRSPRFSTDFSNGVFQNKSAWGMVIVTGGLRGELRTFQNFGLPVRL